jgi:hypothetical protein
LRQQISDIITSLLSIPALSVNLTSTSITDLKAFVRVSRVLFRAFNWRAELLNTETTGRQYDQRKKLQEALDQEEWYATVEDLQRVWTNALRHRVRVNRVRHSVLQVPADGVYAESTVSKSCSTEQDAVNSKTAAKTSSCTASTAQGMDEALAHIFQGMLARCT